MHSILLSGGSGKRLWPLSNEVRSKQFLRLLDDGHGGRESMLHRVYRQLITQFPDVHIVIATSETQEEQIRTELGDAVDIVLEPHRRDTFPAIALSCAFLSCEQHVAEDEVIAVLPVDVYASQEYFSTVHRMVKVAEQGTADLVLMGIRPTFPSEKFGYILPESMCEGYEKVASFVEKPQREQASSLIEQGALWNGGVFVFRLGYVLDILRSRLPYASFADVRASYASLEKTSFDYAVVECATHVAMVAYTGPWEDLGTWDALAQEIGTDKLGNAFILEDSSHTVAVNELDIPVVAMGTHDLIVAASPDGVLVCDRQRSASLKQYADTFSQEPRHYQGRWGTRTVVDRRYKEKRIVSETRILCLYEHATLSIEADATHTLLWVVLEGTGRAVINDVVHSLEAASFVRIPPRNRCSLVSQSAMRLTEVMIETN